MTLNRVNLEEKREKENKKKEDSPAPFRKILLDAS